MSLAAFHIVLTAVSILLALAAGVGLLARLEKWWQVMDIAHVVWGSASLINLVFFGYFLALGYGPAQFLWILPAGAIYLGLLVFRSAGRIQRRRRGQIIRRQKPLDVLILVFFLLNLVSLAVLLRLFTPPPSPPNPPLASLPVWKPSPVLLGQLDPETFFESSGVRPPAGFILSMRQRQTSTSVNDIYEWSGPKRPDGTGPVFLVRIEHPRRGPSLDTHLAQLMSAWSEFTRSRHPQYTCSGIQFGNLNGLESSRLSWTGLWPTTHTVDQGLIYIASSRDAIIVITGTDAEPYARTTLPLCEAAALTFHRY